MCHQGGSIEVWLCSMAPSQGRIFFQIYDRFRETTCPHVTRGPRWSLRKRWRTWATASTAFHIVNWPPTPHLSRQVNSGDFSFLIEPAIEHPSIRPCDSRNLNLSPFCNLSASSLVKWQPAVNSTYGDITTSYTSRLPGPIRLMYPTSEQSQDELLSSLTEVKSLLSRLH